MSVPRLAWIAGWAVSVGLVAVGLFAAERASAKGRAGSLLERHLGPFANLAASIQWARVDFALRRGDTVRAYALAETALEIAPGEPQGWIFLAHHLLYERASLEREPDAVARARWIHAGLDVLSRGERRVRDPSPLLLERGVALAFLAALEDQDRAWPASASEAWGLAAEAFDEAAARGLPRAADAAALARKRAGDSTNSR